MTETAAPTRGEFCHKHFSWLCQAGQGKCQRGDDYEPPKPGVPSPGVEEEGPMTHRERTWGRNTLSRPGADAASSLPGAGGGASVQSADPRGNREQRRAAERLGMTADDREDEG
jgi:hypothetical protein